MPPRKPKLPPGRKRIGVYLMLPPWLVAWLRSSPASNGRLVEDALKSTYGLKPPEDS